MHKSRLEAFSDGVIAIILTIMVLELKVPNEPTLAALGGHWPIYVAYALSYLNVFFVWLNHHRIFAALERVDDRVLWANGGLLFVVSLVPFATAFASQTHWTAELPVVLYGGVMVGVALAFVGLRLAAGRVAHGQAAAAAQRTEARISLMLAAAFLAGTVSAWFLPRSALLVYAAVPIARMWWARPAPSRSSP